VREVNPESRKKGTYFDFAVVSPASGRGNLQNGMLCHYNSRDIGTTVSGTKGMDDGKTLAQARFTIGDYLDIAITPPNPSGGRPHRLDRMNDNPRDHRDNRDRGGNRGWRSGGGGFGDRRRRPY